MALGLALIVLAGSLFAYNNIIDKKAGQTAKAMLDAVDNRRDKGLLETASNGEKVIEIDGMECIGTIEIPSLEIELPVQSEWSKPNLKLSPCRYSGSLLEGSLIICGHNYRNHFGKLKYIEKGDTVIITDATGTDYKYKVSSVTVLGGSDVEEMKNNDGWDMTLFTCDYSGRNRIAVRCIRA